MPELAPLVALAAVIAGAVALGATRQPVASLGVMLDLLLAAGLLRLSGDPPPEALATAAAVVALRRLTASGLRKAARASKTGT